MKHLYFVRHGESEINAKGIWGSHSQSPLTELGKEQARAAGIQAQKDSLHINLMLVSPLKRAQETAQILASYLGNPPTKTYNKIIERFVGDIEGTGFKDFFDNHTYKDLDTVPNAETIKDMQKRANLALEEIKSMPEDNILLVSHSAFGRAVKRAVKNEPWQKEYETDRPTSLIHAEIFQLI